MMILQFYFIFTTAYFIIWIYQNLFILPLVDFFNVNLVLYIGKYYNFLNL